MPEEQLKAFLKAVEADAGLQEKVTTAGDADAVVAIAKEAGFAITVKELKQAQPGTTTEALKAVSGSGWGWRGDSPNKPGRNVLDALLSFITNMPT